MFGEGNVWIWTFSSLQAYYLLNSELNRHALNLSIKKASWDTLYPAAHKLFSLGKPEVCRCRKKRWCKKKKKKKIIPKKRKKDLKRRESGKEGGDLGYWKYTGSEGRPWRTETKVWVRDMVVRRTKPTAAAGVGLERDWETEVWAAKTILPQQHVNLDQ